MSQAVHPAEVTVELSPLVGKRVLEFVERTCNARQDQTLQAAQEKLDDAVAAAQWLRESVQVNMEGAEALKLLEALQSVVDEYQEDSDDFTALATAVDGLAAVLAVREEFANGA